MFKTLLQATYKDDNGREIDAGVVEFIAPYRHIADGFYCWECGQCREEHQERSCGWPISGQVMCCRKCGQMSLLVRTNCVAIDEALSGLWRSAEMADENNRLKDIQRFNEEQIVSIKRQLAREIQRAMDAVDPGDGNTTN